MSNQAEPKNNTNPNTSGYRLTTKSLGVADTNVKDFAGFMLSQEDISTAAMKILLSVGIKNDAIRCIKVGCDESKTLKIFAEIYKDALKKDNDDEDDMLTFRDYSDDDDSTLFPKEFFNTLKNKVYHKHLNYKIIRRVAYKNNSSKKTVMKKVVQIEFDPEIFIAFVYNLNFTDKFYRISCRPRRWMSEKEANKKYDRKSDVRKYMARKNEYINNKLMECTVVVTFTIDKTREEKMYDNIINKIATNLGTTTDIVSKAYGKRDFYMDFNNTLSSGDFNPKQVSQWRDDEDDED